MILVVDDDAAMCRMLQSGFAALGGTRSCTNTEDAWATFCDHDFDVVITDVRMGGGNGLALCKRIADGHPGVPVVVITAFGSMDTAIEAIRAGAYDFVTKPFELDRIRLVVERAISHRQLQRRVVRLERALAASPRIGELVGDSAAMASVYDLVGRIADSNTTVLLRGESGTGKELIARAIHTRSRRAAQPFVTVDCASMPATLLESELFGHKRGAYTDAKCDRIGLFQAATGGTLFLDEVGEIPLELQPKLLRALQERRVRPVGGNEEVATDVRVVGATNRDLERAVREGTFREDLYYRLHVIEVELPALRLRGNDVLLLSRHFLQRCAADAGKAVTGITPAAARMLLDYPWPGNVRELQNCIERAVTLTRTNEITVDDLPRRLVERPAGAGEDAPHSPAGADPSSLLPMDEIERRYVLRVFRECGGNKSLAAKILGVNRKTLYRKLVRYGVAPPEQDRADEPREGSEPPRRR